MFAKPVINSARFLRMPPTSRLLYYDLGMAADDDGIVEAFTVIRTTGAAEDDLRVLASKGFVVILNEDLVSYITDWRTNNQLRKDRYTPSVYANLLANAMSDTQAATIGLPDGNQAATQYSLVKGSIEDKKSIDFCAEAKTPSAPQTEKVIISLPLNDKNEYPISEEQYHEWESLYPAVDVIQQLRSMRGWLDANPTRRKTRNGIKRFITNWLSKEQNRGGSQQVRNAYGGPFQDRRYIPSDADYLAWKESDSP